jgi:hypothetical protein
MDGILQRMDDARNTETIGLYQANLHKNRPKGRPKDIWKDDVQNDVRKMGIVNWRQVAQDRDRWKRATGTALVLFG